MISDAKLYERMNAIVAERQERSDQLHVAHATISNSMRSVNHPKSQTTELELRASLAEVEREMLAYDAETSRLMDELRDQVA